MKSLPLADSVQKGGDENENSLGGATRQSSSLQGVTRSQQLCVNTHVHAAQRWNCDRLARFNGGSCWVQPLKGVQSAYWRFPEA